MSGQGGARIKDTEKRGQTGASKERDGSGSEGPREIRGGSETMLAFRSGLLHCSW